MSLTFNLLVSKVLQLTPRSVSPGSLLVWNAWWPPWQTCSPTCFGELTVGNCCCSVSALSASSSASSSSPRWERVVVVCSRRMKAWGPQTGHMLNLVNSFQQSRNVNYVNIELNCCVVYIWYAIKTDPVSSCREACISYNSLTTMSAAATICCFFQRVSR